MNKDEALRLALEALKEITLEHGMTEKARTAIKAALEAKDEPWEKFCDSHCVWTDHHPDCKLAEQKPVAWLIDDDYTTVFHDIAEVHRRKGANVLPLYTTPPPVAEPHKRPSRSDIKPLTDEQIEDLCWTEVDQRLRSFARAIEAAHGIKGEA